MTLSQRVLYYGSDDPLPVRRWLRAGPLALCYEAGDLRYVRLGDHEILRRVYVAVRDRNWDTLPLTLSNVRFDLGARTFRITYDAEHRQAAVQGQPIHFVWRGTLTGDAQGTLTFTMDGVARSTFWRNRIGFCVLHPMQACAGRPCVVEHSDGTRERGVFPRFIAPHQPFLDIRALTHEVIPDVRAEVRFSGDVFEMEDQRNWTDASYKTYSTPLALPFPVEVPVGTRITQRVTLTLQGDVPARCFIPTAGTEGGDATQVRPLTFTVCPSSLGRLPHVGLSVASHGQPLSSWEVARLKALHLAHLRVDVPLAGTGEGGSAGAAALHRAVVEAQALGVPLEVALFLSADAAQELPAFVERLRQLNPQVCRWLIFHTEEKATTQSWLELAREHLMLYAPHVPIVAGTNAYFAELNRVRPPIEMADAVCYAITPQVHAFDNTSLVETLPTQAVTVGSARRFVGDLPIVISPVTLRPRFNPNATAPTPALAEDRLPPQVDVRQMALLGAGWTLGSLKYLAERGVASVTYYETTGWRGVMARAAGSPLPEQFRAPPGAVFPLYHVLAAVGAFAGGDVLPITGGDLRILEPVVGLALRQAHRLRVMLANLTPTPQRVMVRGLAGEGRVYILDACNAEQAMTAPEVFRAGEGERLRASEGGWALRLLPYAVVWIDADAPGAGV
jgi:hypothetical protein